ncbi:MAG: DUF3237 domain-containing protein [Oscillospiraceae bacterium]|nr:DUF3237 domain-containing protein [Oscillospiraceae bacterium]
MRELIPFESEYLFSYAADVDPDFEMYDPSAHGFRLNGYIVGGKVWGPKVNGRLRAVGADWCTGNPNGIQNVNVRTTILTDDGAKIYMTYVGRNDIGDHEAFEKYKKFVFPEQVRNAICFHLETDDPRYEWANRTFIYGFGMAKFTDPVVVRYDVYALKSTL